MLIDEVTIEAIAGHGGAGGVFFSKNFMTLGPTGGTGGKGGSVYFEGVSDIGTLSQFRYEKVIRAGNGEDGKKQLNDGTSGKDVVVFIPVGTVIHNITNGTEQEVTKIGERICVAEGGRGGKGNYKFRSSRETTPRRSQSGLPGEEFHLRLELKLIADVGLIGLPNVGKSSLLNSLTAAKSKVGNYRFTTLEPYLGAYYELILADIPGIIEGASEGKGLGTKFLRHVERTKVLFHLVSADADDVVADYRTIREELRTYNPAMLQKKEYVFLSRADEVSAEERAEKLSLLKKKNKNVQALSLLEEASLDGVKDILREIIKDKLKSES